VAFRLATWNVNSLNVRLPHLLDWLASEQPDAMCLQETKTADAKFPAEACRGLPRGLQRAEDLQRRRHPVAHRAA
jgi:exonuclease III